ncbi:acyltransferase-like protein [Cordyceps javanica]|uniref:Acyltransferase-like protein n=1 Tax=Cordyceps javanica TaxID=43265 RepID=A0A545VCP0_9HYPO|nr:acyltransferase-like protein [Cordyceps javanica]TQW10831.1 acyltransferase-like protein [Cordyceps javanica]
MWKPSHLATVLNYVTPSFLSPTHIKRLSQPRITPTSYIDGLRGYAAVIVVIFHTSLLYSDDIVFFTFGLDESHYNPLQLPIVRLFFSGHGMVSMFFVLGGYVNALRPLSLIRSGNLDDLAPALSSSLLRRFVRLCLPPLVSTFIIAMTVYLGLWEPARSNLDLIRFTDGFPPRQDTLIGELGHWCSEMMKLFNLASSTSTQYDVHLWTVPTELRASLVLLMSLLMLARCTTTARLSLMALLTAYTINCGRWEMSLYLAGAYLAELEMMRSSPGSSAKTAGSGYITPPNGAAKPDGGTEPRPQRRPLRRLGLALILFTSLFLLSCPSEAIERSAGYRVVLKLVPSGLSSEPMRFIHGLGAVMAVYVVSHSKTLQQPFTSALSQYLGSISYSLYIMHGPVLHIVSLTLVPALWRIIGSDTEFRYNFAVFSGNAIAYVLLFWAADLFYTHVDLRSVKLSRRFEQAVTTERATNH